MRLQCSVLDALRGERSFIGDCGVRKCGSDIAVFAMGFRHDVAWAVGNAMLNRLVAVQDRRARRDRLCRIKHRRQYFILDLETAAAFFGGSLGLRDHGRDLLPDEANDLVEHARVVRIHPRLLVPCGGEQQIRCVFRGQHRLHAGDGKRRALVD